MTDIEKAHGLIAVGWAPAGNGDGPMGEEEWWPPVFIEVPEMTCSFEEACQMTEGAAARDRCEY